MPKIIAITGTPGVGKTSIAKKLVSLTAVKVVFLDIKKLAEQNNLIIGKDKYGSKIIDIKKLQKIINAKASGEYKKNIIVIEGHLLSDMKFDNAIAIVMREHLSTLKKRLLERKYPLEKIRDNLICEATDYCGINACRNYKHVYEFMSSGEKTYEDITEIIISQGRKRNKFIELAEELKEVIAEDPRFAI